MDCTNLNLCGFGEAAPLPFGSFWSSSLAKQGNNVAELAGLIYDSVLSPQRWDEFLALLGAEIGCNGAAITLHDSANLSPTLTHEFGLSPDVIEEWNAQYGSKNPRAGEMKQMILRTGMWISTNSLSQADPAYRESDYVRWLEQRDMFHSLLLAFEIDGEFTSVSLVRHRSAMPFSGTSQALMQELAPHIRRAIRIRRTLEHSQILSEAGTAAIDRSDMAVLVLDDRCRVIEMNAKAVAVLRIAKTLSIRGGQLVARSPLQSKQLDEQLRLALQGKVETVKLNCDGMQQLALVLRPVWSGGGSRPGRPLALAFLYDPATKPGTRETVLRHLFGLSPAECRLAALLHQGAEVREAAGMLRVTETTARFMLKTIFRKTGLHRQSEFIGMLGRLPLD